jgi:hypothetical protein
MRILARRQGVLAAILIFSALIVSGCTIDATSYTRIDIDRPEGHAAIPLSIGVYFSPEFLACEDSLYIGSIFPHQVIFRFGQTSADVFDGVFRAAFEEVHFLKARPPLAADSPDVVGVIEPRIEQTGIFGRPGNYVAKLVYQFRLYDRSGNLILSWNASGQAESNPEGKWLYHGSTEQDDALKQAGESLMRSLYNDSRVSAWFKTQGVDLAGQQLWWVKGRKRWRMHD